MAPVATARLRMCYPPRKWLLGVQATERNQLGSLGLPIYIHSRYNMDIIEYIGSKYVQINRCTFRVKQSCRHWVFCFEWQQQTCWTWMFQYIVIIVTCRFPFFSTLSFMLKATEMIFMTTCSSRPETRFKKCMNPTYLVMAVKDSCLKRESLCRLPIRHFALFVVGLANLSKQRLATLVTQDVMFNPISRRKSWRETLAMWPLQAHGPMLCEQEGDLPPNFPVKIRYSTAAGEWMEWPLVAWCLTSHDCNSCKIKWSRLVRCAGLLRFWANPTLRAISSKYKWRKHVKCLITWAWFSLVGVWR